MLLFTARSFLYPSLSGETIIPYYLPLESFYDYEDPEVRQSSGEEEEIL